MFRHPVLFPVAAQNRYARGTRLNPFQDDVHTRRGLPLAGATGQSEARVKRRHRTAHLIVVFLALLVTMSFCTIALLMVEIPT